jgi:hypothetical protein
MLVSKKGTSTFSGIILSFTHVHGIQSNIVWRSGFFNISIYLKEILNHSSPNQTLKEFQFQHIRNQRKKACDSFLVINLLKVPFLLIVAE